MRLSDIMSHLQLAIYPILALPLFTGVFVAVVLRVLKRTSSRELDLAGNLPLEEGERVCPALQPDQRSEVSPALVATQPSLTTSEEARI